MNIKPGVSLRGMQPQILLALIIAEQLYPPSDGYMMITSVSDGQHKLGSLHHVGLAVDIRPPTHERALNEFVERLQHRLGYEYDVVLEDDHIHIEYQP